MKILTMSNCPVVQEQGSGYVISGFVSMLRALGHDVECMDIRDVTLFPNIKRLVRLRRLIGYTIHCLVRIASSRFDVIELWGAEGWISILMLRAIRAMTGARYIIVSRSNGLETHYATYSKSSASSVFRLIQKIVDECHAFAFRFSDILTLVSEFDHRYACRQGYRLSSTALIMENALPHDWLNQNIRYDREKIVGFVGGWLENKGVEALMCIMEHIIRDDNNVKFLLVGIGRPGAVAIASRFGRIDQIVVIESCSKEEMKKYYHRMSVLLILSRYESFSLAAAEAMSCGVALISTSTGFPACLLESECMHISANLPCMVVNSIQEILANDDDRRARARAAYCRVQKLDWVLNVNRLEAAYYSQLNYRY